VANVGVNTNDSVSRGLRSPVFPDGTFEFVPIKERADLADSEAIPTYAELRSWTGRAPSLAAFVPQGLGQYRAHADPEFETHTYGDVVTPRAANLARTRPGDEIWFLARLWNHDGTTFAKGSGFFLVGLLRVEKNVLIPGGVGPEELPSELRERIAGNAHYGRLLAGEREPCRVLIGDPGCSRRFARALAVSPEIAGHLYGGTWDPVGRVYVRDGEALRNRNGRLRSFETFGSVTRSIQSFLDSDRLADSEHLRILRELAARHGASSPNGW